MNKAATQGHREDCRGPGQIQKSWAHTIDCERGVWGHAPGNVEILHALKSSARMCTQLYTHFSTLTIVFVVTKQMHRYGNGLNSSPLELHCSVANSLFSEAGKLNTGNPQIYQSVGE